MTTENDRYTQEPIGYLDGPLAANPMNSPEDKINWWASKYNVTAKYEFVPFSRSRNANDKLPSLNWKITLYRNGREFMRFDYGQGCAHAPSYNKANNTRLTTYERNETIKRECETGKLQSYLVALGVHSSGKPIDPPKLADVLYSICMDSDAIEYGTFEEWASNTGYEPDSRKAEAIYNACVKEALKMRGAVGDKAMSELRDATQDY